MTFNKPSQVALVQKRVCEHVCLYVCKHVCKRVNMLCHPQCVGKIPFNGFAFDQLDTKCKYTMCVRACVCLSVSV